MIRKAAILALIVTIVFAVASCEENGAGPKDKTPPTVEMLTPWDGTVRDGIVDVTVEADDDAGIARVELYVNNKLYDTDTTKPYSFQWDMGELADGSENTLFVKAVDGHGNKAVTEIITVTKGKTAAPVAKITSPSDGTTIKQGETLVLSGTATDEDEGDLSDSQITWSSHLQGTLGQGLTLSYRGLVIGEHIITMTAIDSNGITDKKTVKVTVVDNDLPYATVEKGTYYIGEPVFKRRTVRLTKGFYIYKTEMTVQEFLELWAIAAGSPSSPDYSDARKWADKRNKKLFDVKKNTGLYIPLFEYGGKSKDPITTTYSNYPACFITYIEACVVCNAMSDRDGLDRAYIYLDKNGDPTDDFARKMKTLLLDKDANGWRLPTEAEFEVAARAGFAGAKFPWGDFGPGGLCNSMSDPSPPNPLDLFNGRGICPIDSYEPNRYGLYNIVGNVAEMCSDMFVGTPPSGVDPVAILEEKNPRYLAKGGAWYEFGENMQIGMRHLTMPFSSKEKDAFNSGIGLRVVRNAD